MKKKVLSILMIGLLVVSATVTSVPMNVWATEEELLDGPIEEQQEEAQDDPLDGPIQPYSEEYEYLDSNMRLSWGVLEAGSNPDYQSALITNYGTQSHYFTVSVTNPDMWDWLLPNTCYIMPGQTIAIPVRPDLSNSRWGTGDYSDVLTVNGFDSNADSITDSISVNLYTTIEKKVTPWVSSVTVSPSSVSLSQGQTYTFSSSVVGGDGADLSVSWSIQGASSGSTAINNGTLVIGGDESSSNLIVKATSNQDSSIAATANVSINKKAYTIATQSSPNNGGSTAGGGTYNKGDSCTVVANPANGFKFDGWYNASNNKITSDARYTFTVNESMTLTARFAQNSIRITTKTNIPNAGTYTESQTIMYGGNYTVKAKAKDGFRFVGWYDGNTQLTSSDTYTASGVTSDRTLSAIFVPTQYTVNLGASPKDGGTVSGGGTFKEGVTVTMVAKPANGYEFAGWINNNQVYSNDATATIKNLNDDYSMTALFKKKGEEKTYTIGAATDSGNGTITPSGNIPVTAGKSMVFNISSKPNYQIMDVKVDGKSVGAVSSYTFYNVDNSHTIVASFAPVSKPATNGSSTTTGSTKKPGTTGADSKPQTTTPTTKPAEDGGNVADDVSEVINMTGTLQDLNVTEEEARGYIQNKDDRILMENALYRGDLQVTVVNRYSDIPNETAISSYYEISSVPNIEDVIDSVLTEDQKLELFKGTLVRTNLAIGNMEEASVPEIEKAVFDSNTYANGIKLDNYFDIRFITEVGGYPELVTNLSEPMEVIMKVSDDMKSNGAGRYCVMRYHDGEFSILPDEDSNPDTVTFHTDRMSTFAMGYYTSGNETSATAGTIEKDITEQTSNTAGLTQNPQKSNNVVIYIMIGVIVVGFITIIALVISLENQKKRRRRRRRK